MSGIVDFQLLADLVADRVVARLQQTAPNPGELLDEKEVAAELRVTRRCLQQWRHRHTGPPFVRLGKHIRYRADVLRLWVAARDSDSQPPT